MLQLQMTFTCQCRIMLHTNPRVNFGFPSTMSLLLILTSLTWKMKNKNIDIKAKKNPQSTLWKTKLTLFCSNICRALLTLFKWWTRIRPRSLFWNIIHYYQLTEQILHFYIAIEKNTKHPTRLFNMENEIFFDIKHSLNYSKFFKVRNINKEETK